MDFQLLQDNSQKAADLLKAFSNEARILILCQLYKNERSVTELNSGIGLSQSALSQHLARLRKDGLVTTRRNAQTIYYSLEDPAARAILQLLHSLYKE